MKCGNISCTCGQAFYFETEMESIRCLQCGAKFDTMSYPEKVEFIEVETVTLEEELGFDPAALV